ASQFVAATTLNTVTASGNEGSCETSASAAVVAPCVLGYPFTSSDPRTSVAFNESEVLRAFRPPVVGPGERLMVFYNDEHALTLGARQVLVKSNSGTVTTGFHFTVLMSSADGAGEPGVRRRDRLGRGHAAGRRRDPAGAGVPGPVHGARRGPEQGGRRHGRGLCHGVRAVSGARSSARELKPRVSQTVVEG